MEVIELSLQIQKIEILGIDLDVDDNFLDFVLNKPDEEVAKWLKEVLEKKGTLGITDTTRMENK